MRNLSFLGLPSHVLSSRPERPDLLFRAESWRVGPRSGGIMATSPRSRNSVIPKAVPKSTRPSLPSTQTCHPERSEGSQPLQLLVIPNPPEAGEVRNPSFLEFAFSCSVIPPALSEVEGTGAARSSLPRRIVARRPILSSRPEQRRLLPLRSGGIMARPNRSPSPVIPNKPSQKTIVIPSEARCGFPSHVFCAMNLLFLLSSRVDHMPSRSPIPWN